MKYEKILKLIECAESIAIFAHVNPDGDTIGSAAALSAALGKLGKQCGLFCDNAVPQKYHIIPYSNGFQIQPEKKFDLAVAVDCADLMRLGNNADFFKKFNNTINIDHHSGNDNFADINVIENSSSTAEIVFRIIKKLNVEIDAEIATALFIGLTTDTGSFQHGNTDVDSFRAAAELLDYGVDAAGIAFEVFKSSSLARTKLLGKVLSRMRSYCGGKVSLVYTLASDFDEAGLDKSATEFFVDYAIAVEGTAVGVSLCQYSENTYKASLRSRGGVDVSEICRHFGGGGHKQAAGCLVSGFFEDVIEKILRQIEFSW